MGLSDIFKSKTDREREAKLRRMRAISGAERVVDTIKDKVHELKLEKDKHWKEAIQYGRENQKASAQRCLKSIMFVEQQIAQLETRRWSFEQLARSLELASIDADIQRAAGQLLGVTEVDVVALESELTSAFDKVRDVNDANKVWDRISRKQLDGVNVGNDQQVTMEELEGRLGQAVASEIGAESQSNQKETLSQIGKGREELKNLLDKQK